MIGEAFNGRRAARLWPIGVAQRTNLPSVCYENEFLINTAIHRGGTNRPAVPNG